MKFTSLVDYPSSPGTQATRFFEVIGQNTGRILKPQPTKLRNDRVKNTRGSNLIAALDAKTMSFSSVQENNQASPLKFYDIDESGQPWSPDRLVFRSFKEAAHYQAEHGHNQAEADASPDESNASRKGKRKRTPLPAETASNTAQRRTGVNMPDLSPQRKKLRTGARDAAQETDVDVRFESRLQSNMPGIGAGSRKELDMINKFVTLARVVEGHGGPVFPMID